jgi:hypothetical protein
MTATLSVTTCADGISLCDRDLREGEREVRSNELNGHDVPLFTGAAFARSARAATDCCRSR